MKDKSKLKRDARIKKKIRIRKRLSGTSERPRLVVYRSNMHISAQIVNDDNHEVICSASSFAKDLRASLKDKSKSEFSLSVGKSIAEKAKAKGVKAVVFDRNGFIYHGRVKILADACRKNGLEF
ncbi:MAG: 50S ribosomal protein L18 [Candidatus Marinimicrobia bacterium]|nr:50S ribosomal protein L18 [Candidatus Neomarinimicrobiota bacterium]